MSGLQNILLFLNVLYNTLQYYLMKDDSFLQFFVSYFIEYIFTLFINYQL